jgi:hypothetical protein
MIFSLMILIKVTSIFQKLILTIEQFTPFIYTFMDKLINKEGRVQGVSEMVYGKV